MKAALKIFRSLRFSLNEKEINQRVFSKFSIDLKTQLDKIKTPVISILQ